MLKSVYFDNELNIVAPLCHMKYIVYGRMRKHRIPIVYHVGNL
jgi:hypothetical protein